MSKKIKRLIALSIIPQYLLLLLIKDRPDFVEQYYSRGFYPVLSKVLNASFRWIPFSFGDLLYLVAISYILRWLVINWKKRREHPIAWSLEVLSFVSVLYFVFHLCWGLNYYRSPLEHSMGLNTQYSTEKLITITTQLAIKTNALQLGITNDSLTKVNTPYAFKELTRLSQIGYTELETKYPIFEHPGQNVKKSIYSTPLTYMGFAGYLNPFSLEAQVNSVMPKNSMLTTIAHEQAHQLGYAAENEANFIGFLACIHTDNPYFNYAGYAFALRYCLQELRRRDNEAYTELLNALHPGILKDFRESSKFWKAYNNPLEPLIKRIYSHFLKANNQEKGIESYSYVVALLVDYLHKN
tara:strand:+ start:1403 stop:2464 length:1062 start_codon:yes stop_codon:yes gene_type:complete